MRKVRVRTDDRKKRVPFGVMRLKMNLDAATMERLKKEKKVARWVNDDGSRIIDAQNGGYEFIETVKPVATGDVVQEEDRRIRHYIGTHKDGSPKYAYAMAIPERFYKEDQDLKEEENKRVDAAIMGGNPRGLSPHGVDKKQGSTYLKGVDYKP